MDSDELRQHPHQHHALSSEGEDNSQVALRRFFNQRLIRRLKHNLLSYVVSTVDELLRLLRDWSSGPAPEAPVYTATLLLLLLFLLLLLVVEHPGPVVIRLGFLSMQSVPWAIVLKLSQDSIAGFTRSHSTISVAVVCLLISTVAGPIALFASSEPNVAATWATGPPPTTGSGCEARVEPQQARLFEDNVYLAQFARISKADSSGELPAFNEALFKSIQHDQSLCYQGFQANGDLMGLGVRLGFYIQWIASMLSNHLLPGRQRGVMISYLILNVPICLATFVYGFSTCAFSIEIEVLYWLYWGGVLCVFTSSPNKVTLGDEERWVGWEVLVTIQTWAHLLMLYHWIWFFNYGYDQVLARMPCGTYHFFLVPLMDPGSRFFAGRDALTVLTDPLSIYLMLILLLHILSTAGGVIQRVMSVAGYPTRAGLRRARSPDSVAASNGENSGSLNRLLGSLQDLYGILRAALGLPEHGGHGSIRLFTPLHIEELHRYRIRCAVFGSVFLFVAVTAIETTLKWNKVVHIYSLVGAGQYMALMVGLATLAHVLMQLYQQEARRTITLRRHLDPVGYWENGLPTAPATSFAVYHNLTPGDIRTSAAGSLRGLRA